MSVIKVLGSGCKSCDKTMELVKKVVAEKGVDASVEKVTALEEIMKYGVMSTPGVVIDGQVVHSGSIPSEAEVSAWVK